MNLMKNGFLTLLQKEKGKVRDRKTTKNKNKKTTQKKQNKIKHNIT